MEGFEWIFELKDLASGPAADITKSIRQTTTGLKAAGNASDVFDAGLSKISDKELEVVAASKRLDKAQDALQKSLKETGADSKSLSLEQVELIQSVRKAGAEFSSSKSSLDKYNKSIADASKKTSAGGYAMSALKTAAASVPAVLAAIAVAAGAAAAALGATVFSASDFARTTRNAFTAVTGSAEGGAEALKNIRDIAKDTAQPLEEVRLTYGTLVSSGMDPKMATDLSKMRMDWKVMGEEAEAAFGKLTDAMVIGKVEISQFEDIAKNAGGRMALGQALGFTSDMLAETAAGTALLEAKLATLKPDKFLEVVVAMAKAKGELGEVSKGAASVAQRLDSIKETGLQNFVAEADLTGSAMEEILESLEELTTTEDFKDFARDIGDSAVIMGRAFATTARWLSDNWGIIGPVLKWTAIAIGVIVAVIALAAASIVGPMYLMAIAIGALISGLISLYNWVASNWSQFPEMIGSALVAVRDWFVNIATEAYSWGSNIVQGLIDGITGMIGKAVAKAGELASAVANAAKGAFGISSPSTVFAGFGGYLSEGLANGIDRSSGRAVVAAQGLADSVETGVVDALGIHSPSKVLERLGKFTALGFEKGANDNASPWIPEIGDLGSLGVPDLAANVIPSLKGADALSIGAQAIPSADALSIGALAMPGAMPGALASPELDIPAPAAINPQAINVQASQPAPSQPSTSSSFSVTIAPGAFTFSGGDVESGKFKAELISALEDVAKRHGAKAAA